MDFYPKNKFPYKGLDSLTIREMLGVDISSENDFDNVFKYGNPSPILTQLPGPMNLDEDSLCAPCDNNVWVKPVNKIQSFNDDDHNASMKAMPPAEIDKTLQLVTLITIPAKNSNRDSITDMPLQSNQENFVLNGDMFMKRAAKPSVHVRDNKPSKSKKNKTKTTRQSYSVVTRHMSRKSESKKQTLDERSISVFKKSLDDKYYRDHEKSMEEYKKPACPYSALIEMAFKNSPTGQLSVADIYNSISERFPYFKTASNGWKNSIRHNLSLNKNFKKIMQSPNSKSEKKGYLWTIDPDYVGKKRKKLEFSPERSEINKSVAHQGISTPVKRGALDSYNENPGSMETIHSEVDSEDESETQNVEESDSNNFSFNSEINESVNWARPFNTLSGVQLSAGTTYTFNAQNQVSKNIKTLEGNTITVRRVRTVRTVETITGNYVYKPVGTTSSKRKPQLRPLLSSLEMDN